MSAVAGFNAAGIGAGMGGMVGISPADRAAERELAAADAARRHDRTPASLRNDPAFPALAEIGRTHTDPAVAAVFA